MKLSSLLSIISIFLFLGLANGQDRLLTLEEAVLKQRTSLAPKKLNQLQWIKGTNLYTYVDEDHYLRIGDVTKPDAVPVKELGRRDINLILQSNLQDTLNTFPNIKSFSLDKLQLKSSKGVIEYDRSKKGKVTYVADIKLPDNIANQDAENDKSYIAYTVDNNLFIYKPDSKRTLEVTKDNDKNIVNGQSVHREEFGIFKGTFWSKSGDYLAFYRMDQTMVTDYPIVDLTKQPAVPDIIKYPMAGGKSHEVTIGVYKVNSNKTVFLNTGLPKDQYLTNIAWSPDERSIYVAILNRDQNEMHFNQYDARTGKYLKTLFQEKDAEFVEPLHPMEFLKTNAKQFIWQSTKEGFNNIYLYDIDGIQLRNLTAKDASGTPLEVIDVYAFDKEDKYLFFQAVPKDMITRNIYKTEIATGKITQLSKDEGINTAQFSEDGKYFINTYSSTKVPRSIEIISTDGRKIKNLIDAPNPLTDYKMGSTEIFSIPAEDGTPLYCRLIKPVDFDPSRKYPVMVYVYGGPHVQLVTNSWLGGGDMFLQYMAQRGFIVFSLDNRGSDNRGSKFEQSIFRQVGTLEINDQMKGVEYLKTLPYVDASRLGLFGWSYGGFMTTSLMTRKPGVFKTAVAGGPVIDWSYYEVMYTERYMDTPQTNPEGYKQSNLLNYVDKLNGKLLMIHGTSDNVVLWQHSLLYQKAAIDKGVQLDYFVYPGHLHNVLGKDRVHLMKKVSDYFIDNLLPVNKP